MDAGVVRGVVIVESLRVGSSVRGIPLRVNAVTRFVAPPEPPDGSPTWTFLEFESDLEHVDELSAALERALDDALPWYASFKSTDEMFVVFPGRTFRYVLGDSTGKAEAETYARSIGMPESQLDWEQ